MSKAPPPNIPHAEWVAKMADVTEPVNMHDYYNGSGANQTLVMVEGARRISTGMRDRVLKWEEVVKTDGYRVNAYTLTDEAKVFWQNGIEQGMSPDEILSGWTAMQSMVDEVGKKDDE